jgi:UPF0148 protein
MKEYLSSSCAAYTDLVFMAEIDEIMAEYLLKGAKMLAKTCPVCHAPLFEYKGERFCVVCDQAGVSATNQTSGLPVDTLPEQNESLEVPVQTPPPPRVDEVQEMQRGPLSSLEDSISDAMVLLCGRIANEPDPSRCLLYMQAIREGALSIATLRGNEPHHPRRE